MKYLGQKLAPSADIYAMMARNKNSRCFHNRNRPVIFRLLGGPRRSLSQIGYLPVHISGCPKIDSISFMPCMLVSHLYLAKYLSNKTILCHPQ